MKRTKMVFWKRENPERKGVSVKAWKPRKRNRKYLGCELWFDLGDALGRVRVKVNERKKKRIMMKWNGRGGNEWILI